MSESTRAAGQLLQENEALRRRIAALEVEAQRFKATLYSIGDAVIATDANGSIVQMNRVAEGLTGWREAEALGRPSSQVFRILNEETCAEVGSPVTRVLREGAVIGLANHTLLVARDGTRRPIADSGAPIREEHGTVTGVVLVFRDQTEERAGQRALQESERKFHDAVRFLDEGYYCCGVDGVLQEHNVAFNRILGFSSDQDLRGSRLPDFWQHPEDRKEYLTELMSKGIVRNYLINAKTMDGDKLVVMAQAHLVNDAHGAPLRIEGVFTDFTERTRMERELRTHRDELDLLVEERTRQLAEREQLLAQAGRLARVGGWEIDLERNELSWGDVVRQIHEVAPDFRPTVEAAINFYAPEDVPVISEAVRRAIEEGRPFDVELQLITAKKKRLWVRAVGEAVRETGKIVTVRGVFQDINERKLAEIELQQHREHLAELVEQRTAELQESQQALVEAQAVARMGSWEWDAVKDEITGSEEFYRLFDAAPGELVRYAQFVERLHPDDREHVRRDVAKALDQSQAYDTDYRVKLRNDGWREINARGRVVTDTAGQPLRMVGTCLDVSERKRNEEELRTSRERLLFATEGADLGIWNWDTVTGELVWSDKCRALFGIPLEETMSYQRFSEALHPDDRERTNAAVKDALDNHRDYDIEYRSLWPDESIHWLAAKGRGYYGASGKAVRLEGVVLDISGRKEAERQLTALNESLARSNQELEQFAYVASHDLQEPLRMVSSFTQLLAQRYRDQLDQDAKDFIGFAVDGANRMQRLIQDLLEYSRVTSRGQPLTALDAHDALGEAVRNLQAAIQESGALVTNDTLPLIRGDHTQIGQVFQNLIANGIKFHRPGESPHVHVSAAQSARQPGFWTFQVSDNGIGIEPRHFERLFVIFQRLHGKQEYPGTGIGLALCKRIVERHGGRIWLASEAGKGTTLFFTLPSVERGEGAHRWQPGQTTR